MIVVVFRSRLSADPAALAEYAEWAERMSAIARTMPGYVSHKGFAAADGERVTIVEFEDEEGMRAWGRHPDHMVAKSKGRSTFYTEYRIQVCDVRRQSVFP